MSAIWIDENVSGRRTTTTTIGTLKNPSIGPARQNAVVDDDDGRKKKKYADANQRYSEYDKR